MKRNKYIIFSVIAFFVLIGCQNKKSVYNVVRENPITSPSNYQSIDIYEDILTDYKKIVNFRLSADFEEKWNNGNFIEISETLTNAKDSSYNSQMSTDNSLNENWSYMLTGMTNGLENPTRESFGYILKDINADGNAELFWVREDHTILAVFTVRDNSPILLDAFYNRYSCVVTKDWQLYTQSTDGAVYTSFGIYNLSSDSVLICTMQFGTDGYSEETGTVYYKIEDNERISISKSQFDELLNLYPFEHSQAWMETPVCSI